MPNKDEKLQAALEKISELKDLLSEVSQYYTREDDLPNGLLPRIDKALSTE